jgi:hypothetical protein
VHDVLVSLLAGRILPTYEAVRERVRGVRTSAGVPDLVIPPPDLARYDRLLGATSIEALCP